MRIDVHHFHHFDFSAGVDEKLDQILTHVRVIRAQGEQLMTKSAEIAQLIADVNTATNEVASDLQKLRDQIAGGLSADEATTVVAELDALKSRLTVLGQDPENPVPPAPPAP